MSRPRAILLLVVIAIAIGGVYLLVPTPAPVPVSEPVPAASTEPEATPMPAAAQMVAAQPSTENKDEVKLPPAFYRKLPPNSGCRLRLPKGIKSGLRCPDGSFLPLLNGVPYAYPLKRNVDDGPLPPVVAKITDSGGYEWYEHADGSHTTTRWTPMTMPDGTTRMEVVTSHHVPKNPNFGRPPAATEKEGGSTAGPPAEESSKKGNPGQAGSPPR